MTRPLLAVDPGTEKCGVAVVSEARAVLAQEIVLRGNLPMRVAHFVGYYGVETVILGDRTAAREVRDQLRNAGFRLQIVFVDEHRSSEDGRRRYLETHRGQWWERLLPVGLRVPDAPFDDYVAVVLAERYLDGRRSTRIRTRNGG
jgi:RNase H-fold protein (predicted Holliday junction resolvase)